MYLFTFFIYLLTYSVNKKLGFHYSFVYLLFICEFTQSVKTRISLSIYLHIYLFLYSFTWMVLYLFTHNLYIVLLVSSIFSCFHWMKCRFVRTHSFGGQRWTKICLSVSESSGIRSKKKGSISREVNLVLHNHIFFYLRVLKKVKVKRTYISYLTVKLISFVQYCCDPYNRRAMMHAV